MPGGSLQGSYGSMPISKYLEKMEQTCLFEPEDQLDNYMRDSLKNTDTDAPLFESDQPRRDNHSRERLSLRHTGRRTEAEPFLPDGTFTDFEFLNADPRGTAVGPDMMKHRKQQEARGKFIKMGYDDDMSVPSEGRSQARVIQDIKGGFYQVKNRLKVFDESMGTFNTSGVHHAVKTTQDRCLQSQDEKAPEMQDEICNTRSSKVADLSNNTSIGWRRTTDHRFQIAKYNQVRSSMSKDKVDVLKNRENSQIAHDVFNTTQDVANAKSLAIKMIDLSNKKRNEMKAVNNALMGTSKKQKNTKSKRILSKDLINMRIGVKKSQDPTANETLGGDMRQHVRGDMTKPQLDTNRSKKAIVDPFIIGFISSYNKNFTKQQTDDLREKVLKSGVFYGLLQDQSNKKQQLSEIKNELLWSSIGNHIKGISMNVKNYARTHDSTTLHKPKNKNTYDYEQYKTGQKVQGQRRGNIQNPDLYVYESTVFDQKNDAPEHTGSKLVGSLGNKYMTRFINRNGIPDDTECGLSEICAKN
jgi:hypothetical protein